MTHHTHNTHSAATMTSISNQQSYYLPSTRRQLTYAVNSTTLRRWQVWISLDPSRQQRSIYMKRSTYTLLLETIIKLGNFIVSRSNTSTLGCGTHRSWELGQDYSVFRKASSVVYIVHYKPCEKARWRLTDGLAALR